MFTSCLTDLYHLICTFLLTVPCILSTGLLGYSRVSCNRVIKALARYMPALSELSKGALHGLHTGALAGTISCSLSRTILLTVKTARDKIQAPHSDRQYSSIIVCPLTPEKEKQETQQTNYKKQETQQTNYKNKNKKPNK